MQVMTWVSLSLIGPTFVFVCEGKNGNGMKHKGVSSVAVVSYLNLASVSNQASVITKRREEKRREEK
jgi:hypothetical protein